MKTLRISLIGSLLALLFIIPSAAFAATGSFDEVSLSAAKSKPTLTGTTDAKVIKISLENEKGKKAFSSKDIKAKKGAWKARVTKTLKPGTYEATLYGVTNSKRTVLATSTLVVTDSKAKGASSTKGGTLSVSMVPLLMGGAAGSGGSVPVAYVKVSNTGKEAAAIEGIKLVETGSSPDTVVVAFATNDDKGGSRTTVAGSFKNGATTVPLAATIAPGQFRIFTIKAILAKTTPGTQLKINVADVVTGAKVTAKFPLIGTTFTLGQ